MHCINENFADHYKASKPMTTQEKIELKEKELSELKALALKEKEEKEFKVGDWVIVKDYAEANEGNGVLKTGAYRLEEKTKEATGCNWDETDFQVSAPSKVKIKRSHIIRFATEDEIKNFLLAEAEKKGFVKGAKVKTALGNIRTVGGELEYVASEDRLRFLYSEETDARPNIYFQGKWAELLPSTPSIEIGQYKVEFFDNHIKVGCKTMYSYAIKRFNGAVEQWNSGMHGAPISEVTICGFPVSVKKLSEISNHFTK
jgi:hypothetical protein